MSNYAERRNFQRCEVTVCKALLKTDSGRWNEMELEDISAGGLKFISKVKYNMNSHVFIDLCVYNMLSEHRMKLEGLIVREESGKDLYRYGVSFCNINKYNQIQLDEIIKSRITLKNPAHNTNMKDGVFSYLFVPRSHSKKTRMNYK